MFCTNCGKKLYDGDRFCAHCGTRARAEAPEIKPVSQDIVFNPPFKTEAERRTSEIFRGFVSEEPEEQKKSYAEPVNFDWNLDGFPKETRKTDEVDFNWGSVIERRNQQRGDVPNKETGAEGSGEVFQWKTEPRQTPAVPVVDKIDLHNVWDDKEKPEPVIETVPGENVRVRTPLFVEEDFLKRPAVTETQDTEVKFSFADPEPEFAEISEVPELILPEEPVNHTAEVSHEEEAAAETAVEVPENVSAEEELPEENDAPAAEPPMSIEELETEIFGKDYKGIGAMAPDEAIKSTAQLEKFYTYNKKNEEFQHLLDQEYERLCGMEEARRADTESLEFTWAAKLFPDRKPEEPTVPEMVAAEAAEESVKTPVPAATIDFSAVREEARQKKQQAEEGAVPAETEAVSKAEPAESEETKPEETAETSETDEISETSETEAPAESAEPCAEAETASDEKSKLRYSDVFPREKLADDRNHDGNSASAAAAKVFEAFEEDEEEEPRKMNIFVKLIILLLVLLILAEGVILLAKFIAPDSAFSQKADVLVETIMDRLTGGGGADEDGDSDQDVSGDIVKTTYISDILAEKIELPDSIGEVLEDPQLLYDLNRDYSCEDVSGTEEFVNGDWKTGADGETVTYAEGILDTIVGYYGQWQKTNQDTSLIGINKLEIGEIRTGEMGYYVLCRLTFAGADGDDVVKYVTACVKISQDSMVNNKIEEEKL